MHLHCHFGQSLHIRPLAFAFKPASQVMHIDGVAVGEHHRRQGVARALLQAAERLGGCWASLGWILRCSWACSQKCSQCCLSCRLEAHSTAPCRDRNVGRAFNLEVGGQAGADKPMSTMSMCCTSGLISTKERSTHGACDCCHNCAMLPCSQPGAGAVPPCGWRQQQTTRQHWSCTAQLATQQYVASGGRGAATSKSRCASCCGR